jgi:hypothetical protein
LAYTPAQPTLIKSSNKKFKELLFVVPFFGATRAQLKRHLNFFDEIGFDVVLINISNQPKDMLQKLFVTKYGPGLIHTWRFEIESALNQFHQDKLVYSFSNPCLAALMAISERSKNDIKGLVCDSGPAGDFQESAKGLASYYFKINFYLFKLAFSLASVPIFYGGRENQIHDFMKKIPSHIPILSLRGWKDQLISPDSIDKIFNSHPNLNWTKLSFPTVGHLEALKLEPEKYKKEIGAFLKNLC